MADVDFTFDGYFSEGDDDDDNQVTPSPPPPTLQAFLLMGCSSAAKTAVRAPCPKTRVVLLADAFTDRAACFNLPASDGAHCIVMPLGSTALLDHISQQAHLLCVAPTALPIMPPTVPPPRRNVLCGSYDHVVEVTAPEEEEGARGEALVTHWAAWRLSGDFVAQAHASPAAMLGVCDTAVVLVSSRATEVEARAAVRAVATAALREVRVRCQPQDTYEDSGSAAPHDIAAPVAAVPCVVVLLVPDSVETLTLRRPSSTGGTDASTDGPPAPAAWAAARAEFAALREVAMACAATATAQKNGHIRAIDAGWRCMVVDLGDFAAECARRRQVEPPPFAATLGAAIYAVVNQVHAAAAGSCLDGVNEDTAAPVGVGGGVAAASESVTLRLASVTAPNAEVAAAATARQAALAQLAISAAPDNGPPVWGLVDPITRTGCTEVVTVRVLGHGLTAALLRDHHHHSQGRHDADADGDGSLWWSRGVIVCGLEAPRSNFGVLLRRVVAVRAVDAGVVFRSITCPPQTSPVLLDPVNQAELERLLHPGAIVELALALAAPYYQTFTAPSKPPYGACGGGTTWYALGRLDGATKMPPPLSVSSGTQGSQGSSGQGWGELAAATNLTRLAAAVRATAAALAGACAARAPPPPGAAAPAAALRRKQLRKALFAGPTAISWSFGYGNCNWFAITGLSPPPLTAPSAPSTSALPLVAEYVGLLASEVDAAAAAATAAATRFSSVEDTPTCNLDAVLSAALAQSRVTRGFQKLAAVLFGGGVTSTATTTTPNNSTAISDAVYDALWLAFVPAIRRAIAALELPQGLLPPSVACCAGGRPNGFVAPLDAVDVAIASEAFFRPGALRAIDAIARDDGTQGRRLTLLSVISLQLDVVAAARAGDEEDGIIASPRVASWPRSKGEEGMSPSAAALGVALSSSPPATSAAVPWTTGAQIVARETFWGSLINAGLASTSSYVLTAQAAAGSVNNVTQLEALLFLLTPPWSACPPPTTPSEQFFTAALAAPNGAAVWWLLSSPATSPALLRHLRDVVPPACLAQAVAYGHMGPSPPLLRPVWLQRAALGQLISRDGAGAGWLLELPLADTCVTLQSAVSFWYPCTRPVMPPLTPLRATPPPHAQPHLRSAADVLHDITDGWSCGSGGGGPLVVGLLKAWPAHARVGHLYLAAALRSLGRGGATNVVGSTGSDRPTDRPAVLAFADASLVRRIVEFAY